MPTTQSYNLYEKDAYNNFTEEIETLFSYEYAPIVERTFTPTSDVLEDPTGNSETVGKLKELQGLFQNRLERIRPLLSNRRYDAPVTDIKNVEKKAGEEITVIGLVQEVRKTQSDNVLLVLDDMQGETAAIYTDDDEDKEKIQRIMYDEVVAITGAVADDGGIIFINDFEQPDIPSTNSFTHANEPAKAVFISDIHIGHSKFAMKKWFDFVDWVRQTPDIAYIICAGDLVEGVGIFPEQKGELTITDITDQYRACAELFSYFPDDVQIISCTGNHDAIRNAEPQPSIIDDHKKLFKDNVTIIGNPSRIKIHDGPEIMLYHGASIHDVTEHIPEHVEEEPAKAMKELLIRRHLAPEFGNHARIVAEQKDYHVIEDIPDVLHSGHLHTYGVEKYNNVHVINTGGWVYQTAYQKRLNIEPVVGSATILDLSTGVMEEKLF